MINEDDEAEIAIQILRNGVCDCCEVPLADRAQDTKHKLSCNNRWFNRVDAKLNQIINNNAVNTQYEDK